MTNFGRWFMGRRPFRVRELTETGYVESVASTEKYKVFVEPIPDNGTVLVAINVVQHPWLNRYRQSLPPSEQRETLAVEVEPGDIEGAKRALVEDADRRVKAIVAAWEHGWRPGEAA